MGFGGPYISLEEFIIQKQGLLYIEKHTHANYNNSAHTGPVELG